MRLINIWFYMTLLVTSHLCGCWEVGNATQASTQTSTQSTTQTLTQTSTLKSPVERVFSRRKRWLLFPKGTALKFTVNVGKRLLALYPSGLNFVLEAAVYYPMPSARIDLIPKRFRPSTTKAPTRSGPTPLNLISIPGSLIKYRARPATRAPLVQRTDHNVSALQWVPHSSSTGGSVYKWTKYNTPENLWFHAKQKNEYNKYLANKWQSHYKGSPSWHRYGRDFEHFDEDHQEQYFDDLEYFDDSPHYHAHRSRRELFGRLEGFTQALGIDMKSCILRAMCDSKRFLLPPGYSMIQDILRIVLTFPTINGLKDDYSRVMAADYQTCDAYLQHKCPLSLLEWFLNPKRSI